MDLATLGTIAFLVWMTARLRFLVIPGQRLKRAALAGAKAAGAQTSSVTVPTASSSSGTATHGGLAAMSEPFSTSQPTSVLPSTSGARTAGASGPVGPECDCWRDVGNVLRHMACEHPARTPADQRPGHTLYRTCAKDGAVVWVFSTAAEARN